MASQDSGAQSAEGGHFAPPFLDRDRYKSPPPPPSSMTPPPSSQAPALSATRARTITPPPAHLSSPPLTVKSIAAAQPSAQNSSDSAGMYSSEQIDNAPADELRKMLTETMVAYREARASSAHHNLQYTLLCMESSEAIKRMEVEIDMKQKEVEVLQAGKKPSSTFTTPNLSNHGAPRSASPNDRVVLDLKNACQLLEIENDNLRRRLDDAKAALIEREEALMEENDRLRERIRENRSHMSLLRHSSAMPEAPSAVELGTPFVTPAQTAAQHSTQTPSRQQIPSTPKRGHRDQAFAALLLADRVLSQEEAGASPSSAPATRSIKANSRVRNGSPPVPSTPVSKTHGPYYVGPPLAHHILQSPPVGLYTPISRANQHRRRESRDSTISASDLEEQQRELESEAKHAVLQAKTRSSASRHANSVPITMTPTKTPASASSGHSAKQPSLGSGLSDKYKRKHVDSPGSTRASKRGKPSEGVGLGISA